MDKDTEDLFATAELEAERLIAVIRLAVASLVAMAFLFAVVGTMPRGDPVMVRQAVLAVATFSAYFLAGLASLTLASERRTRKWHPFLFVTLDVAFVIGSLWLNRLNTGLPPNFVLVFPVLFLVPIVLTFGALRYGVVLQTYVVGLMAVGLGSLALPLDGWEKGNAITVPAAATPFFAPPPNVMRFVMVLLAGAVLIVVVVRTRRLLAAAIAETRRRLTVTRFLPQEIADLILDDTGAALRDGRRQPVVVMFVDVRDFTGRSEGMDPAALGALLGRLRREIGAAASAHGGIVDKFVGDAAMIVFGVPLPAPGDGERAIACGRDVLARVARLSSELENEGEPPLAVGIGVHAGEAYVGAIGDETRLEFTVVGDTVNVAARVEEATKAAGAPMLATAAVVSAEAALFWRSLPDETLRGRSDPVRLFVVPATPDAEG